MKKKLPTHLMTSVEYEPTERTRNGCILGLFLLCVSAVITAIGFWLLINWALDFWR